MNKEQISPMTGSTIFSEHQHEHEHGKKQSIGLVDPSDNLTTDVDSEEFLFFNFQEYAIHKYEDLATGTFGNHERSLVVTHFPNPYVSPDSPTFKETRIVRIPRIFDKIEYNNYPQFSEYMPGFEPAALIDPGANSSSISLSNKSRIENVNIFRPQGKVYGQLFGCSSLSPLSNYLSVNEFRQIVGNINNLIKDALDPFSVKNVSFACLNFVTLWVFDSFLQASTRNITQYIEEINNSSKFQNLGIKLIDPTQNGFESLDFQIPKPKLV